MNPKRLDKYLADATALSRNQIKAAWQAGRITVEPGAPPEEPTYQLWSLIFEEDRVFVDDQLVRPVAPRHYFALHKPADILSTTSNPQGRACLAPWLQELPAAVFPVGRLDRPTTGFLLLTDDGDLCFCLLRKRFHIEKEYHLTVRGAVAADDRRLTELEEGIDIGDRKPPARALRAQVLDSTPRGSVLSVVVDEGRHRMVRRMARGVDLKLEHLHRPRIGPVQLGDLPVGQVRRLSDHEVTSLWADCGGQAAARQRQRAALARQAARWRDQQRPHRRLERWLASSSGPASAAPKDY